MREIVIDGESFFVRDGSAGELDRNVIAEVYGLDTYRVRQRCYIKPKFIIDVGGHIGSFVRLSKTIWTEAKVICVEPNPVSFQLLQENTKNLTDIVLIEGAIRYNHADVLTEGVGATGGGAMIYQETARRLIGGIYTVAVENVKLYTLEELSKEQEIDLIKLDCEGSEMNIFHYISEECIEKIKYMVGEYHGWLRHFEELARIRFKKHRWEFSGGANIGTFWAWRII